MNPEEAEQAEIKESEQRSAATSVANNIESGSKSDFTESVEKLFRSFDINTKELPRTDRNIKSWEMEFEDWNQKIQTGAKYAKSDLEIQLQDGSYANFYLERYVLEKPIQGLKGPITKISPGACSIKANTPPAGHETPADSFYFSFQKSIGVDHWPSGKIEEQKSQIQEPKIFIVSDNMPSRIPEKEAQPLIAEMQNIQSKK